MSKAIWTVVNQCLSISICALGLISSSWAAVSTGTDKEAQLPYWELKAAGLSLRLVQRLPDQSRAFFAARGFAASESELIAQSCIFQTVIKNDTTSANSALVSYDLSQWKITQQGHATGLKTREMWAEEWRLRTVNQAARIAFEWSLLPTQQSYQQQDYNWGMTSFALAPGVKFNLTVLWMLDRQPQSATIKNIECARDIHPEPSGSEK
ncbi:MAG: hypothetical protein ACC707_01995 [Thiohalomonadales bacterium]